MLKKIFTFPAARTAVAVVVVLTFLLVLPPTRVMAGEFLNLFRVQQVTVLSFDPTGLESMTRNEALGKKLSELVSSSTVITDEPGDPVRASTVEEAGGLAGFTVRLPDNQTASGMYITESSAFTLTIDREKAQALLDGAGRPDLVLPEPIDGAEIYVNIPAMVSVFFGNCPEPDTEGNNNPIDTRVPHPDCIVLGEMTSPTVDTQEDVDLAQLAEIALEFSGMSAEEATAFASKVDWGTTLVIPIPKNISTYSEVSVDESSGTLIQSTDEYSSGYVLLWVKNGILYSVSGTGMDTAAAFAIAEALP